MRSRRPYNATGIAAPSRDTTNLAPNTAARAAVLHHTVGILAPPRPRPSGRPIYAELNRVATYARSRDGVVPAHQRGDYVYIHHAPILLEDAGW